jgi:hypothetical protein
VDSDELFDSAESLSAGNTIVDAVEQYISSTNSQRPERIALVINGWEAQDSIRYSEIENGERVDYRVEIESRFNSQSYREFFQDKVNVTGIALYFY